jgi:4-alpha-glucanotransferase
VPTNASTAAEGAWVPSCGEEILGALAAALGDPLPFIAEDLGVITDAVIALRDRYNLPGIRILQFAFGSDSMKSTFIPEAYDSNCVAYSGTHDNDTTYGWFNSVTGKNSTRGEDEINREKAAARAYFGTDGSEIHLDFIRSLYASKAAAAIVPLQDLLGLGSEARMNIPGQASGSWTWRLPNSKGIAAAIEELSTITANTRRGLTAHTSLTHLK